MKTKTTTQTSTAWLNRCQPNDAWRRRTAAALSQDSGFPKAMSEEILRRNFARMTRAALADFGRKLKRHSFYGSKQSLAFALPGNVPDPTFQCVLIARLLNIPATLKLSSQYRCLAPFVAEWAARLTPKDAPPIRLITAKQEFFRHAQAADGVVVYGHDTTLKEIQSRAAGAAFRGLGHEISAGIVWPTTPKSLSRAARNCAEDVWIYDQRGCLSPQIYFVKDHADEFAALLQAELDKLDKRGAPQRNSELRAERRILLERLVASAVGSGDVRFMSPEVTHSGPVVYRHLSPKFQSPGLGQIVAVQEFRRPDDIRASLHTWLSRLRGLSIDAPATRQNALLQTFRGSSISHISRAGKLQNPPLIWGV